jgi:hypothetical protein
VGEDIKGLSIDNLQIINFYETSLMPFSVTIDQLDSDLQKLEVLKGNTIKENSPTLQFTLKYTQIINKESKTGKDQDKSFKFYIELKDTAEERTITQLVDILSTIRNMGSVNPERTFALFAEKKLSFSCGQVN